MKKAIIPIISLFATAAQGQTHDTIIGTVCYMSKSAPVYKDAVKIDSLWAIVGHCPDPGYEHLLVYSERHIEQRRTITIVCRDGKKINLQKYYQFIPNSMKQ